MRRHLTTTLATAALIGMAGMASAASIQVTIKNESATDGLYLTPFLTVFHDGSYAAFTPGQTASAELEAIAEEGDVSGEAARAQGLGFATAVATGPQGFGSVAPQPPVLDPGEVSTFTLHLDPMTNRFMSFLSMVIPSNDTFIGNGNPMAYEIFDAMGNFTGIPRINVDLADVWDGGTEVNDGLGAAFSGVGGVSTETSDPIGLSEVAFLFDRPTAVGTPVNGNSVGAIFASIEIAPIPLPAGLPLMLGGIGLLGFAARRKRLG